MVVQCVVVFLDDTLAVKYPNQLNMVKVINHKREATLLGKLI